MKYSPKKENALLHGQFVEHAKTWNDPYGYKSSSEDDADSLASGDDQDRKKNHQDHMNRKKKSKKKKSRKRSSRRMISREESSQADSLLSSILSESEREEVVMLGTLGEDDEDDQASEMMDEENDSMHVVSHGKVMKKSPVTGHILKQEFKAVSTASPKQAARAGTMGSNKMKPTSPRSRREGKQRQAAELSSDDEEEVAAVSTRAVHSNYAKAEGSSSLRVQVGRKGKSVDVAGSKNPFENDAVKVNNNPFSGTDDTDNEKNNPFSGDESADDPFRGMGALIKKKPIAVSSPKKEKDTNPFSNTHDDAEGDEDSSVASGDAVETTLAEKEGVIKITPVSKVSSQDNDDGDEDESGDDEDDDDSEEDIVESSKRLLRKVDERIQYQQHSEEVQTLKATIEQMKHSAEAMAEQLRRAVETKCDLVLAQNEMERRHEQDMIRTQEEQKDTRLYIQDLLDGQARSELNFMNEISVLARRLEVMESKHKKEISEKDYEISQVELKLKALKNISSASPSLSSKKAFRGRFFESSTKNIDERSMGGDSTGTGRSSKKSSSSRSSRQKVYPW